MNQEPIETKTPIDYIEPIEDDNPYREASLHFVRILSLCVDYIIASKEPVVASYGVAYALGLGSVTQGKSLRETAEEQNICYANISMHAKTIRQICGLPKLTID